ncbi:Eco57I restriction-modification methylase domain-containing protein [uncultured Chloroflexus sp.]|uniref:Eco57I restriction-modification methylase domain-containing protein n=1 Tax=uncultured Chloroflexus sp. TaxID=214040 RepID=UPI00261F185B|nr:DNA methyltransferase [uncultured Chloroflexus sp.]
MTVSLPIRIEGGLFSPDLVDQLLAEELPGQRVADFGLEAGRSLTDEIAAVLTDASAMWEVFRRRLTRLPATDPATSLTRDGWVIPFLSLLGYELTRQPGAVELGGMLFPISHRAGAGDDAPPVHIVGFYHELGRTAPSLPATGDGRATGSGERGRPAGGRSRLSPHALMQEFLNRSDHLWGIVTNGRVLRVLRNSTYIRRQSYLEFDLAVIIAEQRFPEFAALYRLLHRSRLPQSSADAHECLLERYYQYALEQGGRARDRLRDSVEQAMKILANGFLRHPANTDLRNSLRQTADAAVVFYRQLLRLVYRLLFLLVSEERGLIGANPVYQEHYSVSRLRRLASDTPFDPAGAESVYGRWRRWADDHEDLWHSLRALWMVFADERLAELLAVAPLNGELFAWQPLDECVIGNRDLLAAMWHLTRYQERDSDLPRLVNYAALDTEELGSVYESLLDLHPVIDWNDALPWFQMETSGQERRSTGSHYTPPDLVTPLIQHALEPVLQERLAACRTNEEREAAILNLKVLDPACGSGHFLLAAARRLGKELARLRTGEDEPAPEALRQGVRDAITHCLYGVDKNPLAVELCRVALWLESHATGKPLTFLEHRIRHGDSLVGLRDLTALEDGIPDEAYKAQGNADRKRLAEARKRNARERDAALFRHGFISQPLADFAATMGRLAALPEATIEQVRAKRAAYEQAQNSPDFQRLQLACDVYTAAFFLPSFAAAGLVPTTAAIHEALSRGSLTDARQAAAVLAIRADRAFFHWELEFPEVFHHQDTKATKGSDSSDLRDLCAFAVYTAGFDVILGNPPFMGGLRVSGAFGEAYRKWLEYALQPFGGTADLCAAFFRRAFSLLKPGGRLGMIATNTLGQGDTRESGLAVILKQGGVIDFARRFVKWPGQASVEVNLVALTRAPARAQAPARLPLLDNTPVPFISSRLDDQPEREPQRLQQNAGKAFQGSIVLGMGFVLQPEEAQQLLTRDARNADCLFPYLNGEDLNSHPEQQPSRWVVNFFDWDLERARKYPELIKIVEERVKPEREKLRDNIPIQAKRKKFWWQYGSAASQLYRAIAPLRRVLARSRVSEMHMPVFVSQGWVYNEQTIVFAFDDDYHFALLQSAVHETWLRKQASSLRTDIRYTPTDCFDTFPFPPAEYAAPGLAELLTQPVFARAAQIDADYHEHRRQTMLARQLGLTKIYNLFHNPACQDADIARLRELHVALDNAILACYGWQDVDLGHDFHQNERGQTRFMPAAEARRELIFRLMELNEKVAREAVD